MTAHRLTDLINRGPVGRTKIYEDIRAGRLVMRKLGRASIVLDADWQAYLEGAPIVRPVAHAA